MKITKLILALLFLLTLFSCSSNSDARSLSKVNRYRRGTTPKEMQYHTPPSVLNSVKPIYPQFARNMKIEGEVILDVEVFEDGSAGEIKVLKSLMSGPGGLDEKAIQSVRKSQFTPATNNGKPISNWGTFEVIFAL